MKPSHEKFRKPGCIHPDCFHCPLADCEVVGLAEESRDISREIALLNGKSRKRYSAWTKEEDEYLLANYRKVKLQTIMDYLERDKNAILHRVREIKKLKKEGRYGFE